MAGEIGPTAGDADAALAPGQSADQMASDEARPSEDGDQRPMPVRRLKGLLMALGYRRDMNAIRLDERSGRRAS
jgi:hypothetical protein